MANDKPTDKTKDKTKSKNAARKGSGDVRKDAADRFQRSAERIDTLNRRYFAGQNEALRQAMLLVTSTRAIVLEKPTDWKPQSKGKKALVPGAAVMIKPDLDKKVMERYVRLGGVERFLRATIVEEWDGRSFMVQLRDATKMLLPKRDLMIAPAA